MLPMRVKREESNKTHTGPAECRIVRDHLEHGGKCRDRALAMAVRADHPAASGNTAMAVPRRWSQGEASDGGLEAANADPTG